MSSLVIPGFDQSVIMFCVRNVKSLESLKIPAESLVLHAKSMAIPAKSLALPKGSTAVVASPRASRKGAKTQRLGREAVIPQAAFSFVHIRVIRGPSLEKNVCPRIARIDTNQDNANSRNLKRDEVNW